MSTRMKTLTIWLALIIVFIAFFQYFKAEDSRPPALDSDRFMQNLDDGDVTSVLPQKHGFVATLNNGKQYSVAMPVDSDLRERMEEHGVRFGAAEERPSVWMPMLINVVPILLILGLFLFLMLRLRGGGANILSLRKTTARLVAKPPAVTFADVGGATEAKRQLSDVVDFLKRPQVWQKSGARLPAGVLLEGPPGLGKTLLARAVAGEAKVPFFEVSASEFVEMFVGVGAARVRDLFDEAAKKAPAVIFIDELDAVGRRRGSATMPSVYQEREQTLNQLLVSMDGFRKREGLVVIAATNRADILDAALLRAGRFDVQIRMPPLSEEARMEVLAIHLKVKPKGSALDLAAIAKQTVGSSGADLENLVNQAAVAAVRRNGANAAAAVTIESEDFQKAMETHSGAKGAFDQLDKFLIEAGAQLSRPDGQLVVRATMDDGSVASGEIVWADDRCIKLKGENGANVALSRSSIARIEALGDVASVKVQDIRANGWKSASPDIS